MYQASRSLVLLLVAGLAQPLAAQSAEEQIRLGVEAQLARDPVTALTHLEAALTEAPRSYEANWRAAEVLMDIGKQTPDSVKSPERDSLYARAERYGRTATELNAEGADGHFVLAAAIGRASLTKGKKERVRRASEIRSEALRALEIDPEHHKTYHLLGRWNAEIMRLSGFNRFMAKAFLGGKIFSAASWDSAVVYMEKAVALSPDNIYHHLDLAEIFIDRGRYAEARIHLSQVENLPVYDVMDPAYKERAAMLVTQIAGKKDKDG
ncbi:MAG: tetratricopeptide repeat protein [Gemmatimonadota bacterium]